MSSSKLELGGRIAPSLRALGTAVVLTVLIASHAGAAVDLAAIQVLPQRGQSADQARRDRYECHNWAVEQSGVAPLSPTVAAEQSDEMSADRTENVVNGAVIGAGVGGIVRGAQNKNPGKGVLAGAAIGAIIGSAASRDTDDAEIEDEPDDYLRALSACLEGRGYAIALPGENSS